MDDNLMDDSGDDHQQPLNQSIDSSMSGLGSFCTEYHGLGNANDSIEERFRQLKAVTVRAGLSRRWRRMRNLDESSGAPVAPVSDVNGGRGINSREETEVVMGRNVDRGKGCKRESSLLVAMALEMDSEVKKVREESFYDCNICLYVARDPILTCCGHLFCWACFYKLPYVDSTTAKECPICEGEVTDSNIIPIYGNGDGTREKKLESGRTIPPRPKAQRVESVRQQRVTRGVSDVPVAEAIRRIRISISAMGDDPQQEEAYRVPTTFGTNYSRSLREAIQIPRLRYQQLSSVLSDSATSLSSVSSALSNAERLIEDLETYLNNRRLQRSDAQVLSVNDGDTLTRNAAVIQSEHQTSSSEEINSARAGPSTSGTSNNLNGTEQTENMTTSTASELNLPPLRFHSPSWRRSGSSSSSD